MSAGHRVLLLITAAAFEDCGGFLAEHGVLGEGLNDGSTFARLHPVSNPIQGTEVYY